MNRTERWPEWPQPNGTVESMDRDRDELLSLEPSGLEYRMAMLDRAHDLQREALEASGPYDRRFARMCAAEEGDLVFEMTTAFMWDPLFRVKGFGILLAKRTEWAATDEEWAESVGYNEELMTADNRSTVTAWYIQYGPKAGDICRWTNCMFYAVPRDLLQPFESQT